MSKFSKTFTFVIAAILVLLVCASAVYAGVLYAKKPTSPAPLDCPLYFNEDGTFTILQFADFHEFAYDEDTHLIKEDIDVNLKAYITSAIDKVKPDFVILTGDNTFCVSWLDIFLGISAQTMQYVAEVFEEKKVYWTFTFGNHDTEGGVTKQAFIEGMQDYGYFIGGLENGDYFHALSYDAGTDDYRAGNYSIPVYDRGRRHAAYNIFVLDSGSYPYVPHGVPYRYIMDEQTDWYAAEAEALKTANNGFAVPSIMFTHIPLFEHREAYLQKNASIGVWGGFSPSNTRSSFFAKAMEMGDVRAVFAGHNHGNSYTGFYISDEGKIMLGITPQATGDGYWSNTPEGSVPIMYSRVVTLSENGDLTTWIHTSDKENYSKGVYRNETLSYYGN